MKDSRKQFIIEGHKAACSEWKTKIEKEFPKLFKETELVVGKWYKRCGFLIIIKKIKECNGYNKIDYTGFIDGSWREDYLANTRFEKELTPATDKEVEDALIKEAKKRGFSDKGTKFNCMGRNGELVEVLGTITVYDFYNSDDTELLTWGGFVFKNGKWATIIETITKEEAEKELGKTII